MRKNQIFFDTGKAGFSLIEMIIYISILTLVVVLIAFGLTSFMRSERRIQIEKNIEISAAASLERMGREIRNAISINGSSIFSVHPGVLKLNTLDGEGDAKTVEFFVEDSLLKIKENEILMGALTHSQAKITNLIFRQISGNSSAVKIELTVTSGEGDYIKTENFYSTVILRGSY